MKLSNCRRPTQLVQPKTVLSATDIHYYYDIHHHGQFNIPFAMCIARFVCTPVRLSVCLCYSRQCGLLANYSMLVAFLFTSFDRIIPLQSIAPILSVCLSITQDTVSVQCRLFVSLYRPRLLFIIILWFQTRATLSCVAWSVLFVCPPVVQLLN